MGRISPLCLRKKHVRTHRPQTLGNAVEMGETETSAEMQQVGEKQVLAPEMWETMVIQNRYNNPLSNDGHAYSKG